MALGTREGKSVVETGEAVFELHSLGIKTNRDDAIYDFRKELLIERILEFIDNYNAEVDRYRRVGGKGNIDEFVRYDKIKWSETLKANVRRGRYAKYDESQVRPALYRPFTKRLVYYNEVLTERKYQSAHIYPSLEAENQAIAVSDIGYRAQTFNTMVTSCLSDIHLCAGLDAHQCFPFYIYDEDGTNRRENITDWALKHFCEHYHNKKITKWDIFHYVYGVLHHPGYRERFAENLKRELPRIPLAPDFRAFATAGKKLARLHLDYEKLEPWPLKWIEKPGVPLSYHVEKMRLAKDKTAIQVNDSLTLADIPPEVFEYRLGNRMHTGMGRRPVPH